MIKRLLLAGLSGYFYGKSASDPRQRPNLFASLALQEAEGSRTLEKIRTAKADEIPAWLDELMQRHIQDESRHARIFDRAVAQEGCEIDQESQAAISAMDSVGEGSLKRFHKREDLAEVPLTSLLAGILVAEEAGVRAFRTILHVLPESMQQTRAGVESVLRDEERHVRYLSDALSTLGEPRLAEQLRRGIEERVFNDFEKILKHLGERNQKRPVLVKAARPTTLV